MLSKINIYKCILLIFVSLFATAQVANAFNGVNMWTYTKYSDGTTPGAGDIQFTAFYGGNDTYIHTEDSYNATISNYGENLNEGWWYLNSSIGIARVNTDQFGSVTNGTPYEIWINGISQNEAGKAIGTVHLSSPTLAPAGNSMTNQFELASQNYLSTPRNFIVSAGNGEVFIRWDAVAGADVYLIYRGPVVMNNYLVFKKVGTPSTNYFIDDTVINENAYWYTIVAVDGTTRRSGHPTEVSANPIATGVPDVTGPASGARGGQITITGSGFHSSNTVYINAVLQSSTWDGSSTLTIDNSTPLGLGKLVVIRNDNNLEDNIDFTVEAPDNTKPTSSVTISNNWYGPNTWVPSNTINGTASDNVGVDFVDISIQRSSDNQYWNGTGWQAGIAWNRATGTTTWTYSFAAANMINNINYTVQSRATDISNNVQDSYGSDSFTWDSGLPSSTVTIANDTYDPSTWNESNTINGTASDNSGVASIYVSIQRSSNNQYWNGSSWQAGIAWNRATGTTTWTYSFAAANMSDGVTYTVQSRAVDTCNNTQNIYGLDSFTYTTGGDTGQITFTLYHGDQGNTNWIALPFTNTGLTTTVDLGEAIAATFPVSVDGDMIVISSWNGQDQTSQQTSGIYIGGDYYWDPPAGQPLNVGSMYTISVSKADRLPGELFSTNLTISGNVPSQGSITFDLYHIDEGNLNWISIPWYTIGLNASIDLGTSIFSKFTPSPADGDMIVISSWNGQDQTSQQTSGIYIGGDYYWDPPAGQPVGVGRPHTISINRANRQPGEIFNITWP